MGTMTLGGIIRHHRQRQALSQPELASKAQIEQSYLSKLENDHSLPSDDTFKRVITALELNIADVCAQLDTRAADPRVLHIESIRTYLASFEQSNQRRSIILMVLFTLAIGIGVALFYTGHSKAFFAETLYSYESRGEIRPGEPSDYFHGGWRRAFPMQESFATNNELSQQIREAEIIQANRVDHHTIRSYYPLENYFTRELDNGNRRAYRVQGAAAQIARPQNAWLMFIGMALAISAMIGLMIILRLGPGAHDNLAGGH